jgi:hypothetical protein
LSAAAALNFEAPASPCGLLPPPPVLTCTAVAGPPVLERTSGGSPFFRRSAVHFGRVVSQYVVTVPNQWCLLLVGSWCRIDQPAPWVSWSCRPV